MQNLVLKPKIYKFYRIRFKEIKVQYLTYLIKILIQIYAMCNCNEFVYIYKSKT